MSALDLRKRIIDIVLCVVSLPVSLPLATLAAALVKLSGPGPILYRARRVGRGGNPIDVLKFRTMAVGRSGPAVTRAGDPRVTQFGRWLRASKLDELPQLVNVLRGDMSLVGPRPEDPRYVGLYTANQKRVLSVLPGITSPASVRFRHEEELIGRRPATELEDFYVTEVMPAKLAIDLDYVTTRTTRGDLQIMLRTIGAVCRARSTPDARRRDGSRPPAALVPPDRR